ncbi:SMP-30/gluconolactonase/LRE family protein [Spirosoma taeanense]|uniref:SMP-30/gluconolactonase/LRE family protein n=1 Tax=Spirosoma taeanense TaxID=2735870 RepID=A0A6M5Y9R6_9BACT|nr:SMP-30/gluconolactonase/LRE family protein [Spirosoma taeanense]QJW90010.1 SMP-30/gluconolactonase/LRE family protein [Spirosoma taeanense]
MQNPCSVLLFVTLVIAGAIGTAVSQDKPAEILFKSSVFTQANGFTSGVEGPAVDQSGMLYAVNFGRQGTIGQVTQTGQTSVFVELPEGSIGNGIRFNRQGDMFIADYPKHNILIVKSGSRQVRVLAHESRMNQPNDIAIDRKGRLYASDPNWKANTGNIWRIDPSGEVTLLEANMGTTNGIEVSPDNKTLYVNESAQRKVWAYDLSAAGQISHKRLLIEFPDFGMDGMRCDAKGNLYIVRYGKGTVAKVSPTGTLLQEIALIGKKPTNIAFGGKDGRTAYVTLQDQGNIETFRVDEPGQEWVLNTK